MLLCTNSCPQVNTKLNEYQKHSINKTVRKVINTIFNVIIWGNYSSSKIGEFTNSNTTALLLRIQAELISNMSYSYTNSV